MLPKRKNLKLFALQNYLWTACQKKRLDQLKRVIIGDLRKEIGKKNVSKSFKNSKTVRFALEKDKVKFYARKQ